MTVHGSKMQWRMSLCIAWAISCCAVPSHFERRGLTLGSPTSSPLMNGRFPPQNAEVLSLFQTLGHGYRTLFGQALPALPAMHLATLPQTTLRLGWVQHSLQAP
eukprot:CAMPEP_0175991574 /NCGR_PEP_ID=MMETSP0108-20121206/52928_1 /TAXON_ID=195067 ORGANISM="Goniomonas pacifica, Strain CCMP1869" /NCGR_SAMPLE_ID=MMETSP0108 /ASSEMBLY_ACC=CAM_ASM_000204 /LENGTH=103 /DNA_ID=CAMNT_0017323153 /DNA_START=273 /DNA_END=580 /DNA_ORIENTATION=+